MPASTHIVGMEDVKTDYLARFFFNGNARVGLAAEEIVCRVFCLFLLLWKGDALPDDGIPNLHRCFSIAMVVSSYRYHNIL